jgi:CRISPR-associated protein Cas1
MTDRVLDLSLEPARLSIRNGLLVVEAGGEEKAAIPCSEIAAVVVAHRQVTFTQAVLGTLAASGAILVACDERHMPAAMMLPLDAHHAQAERFRLQVAMSAPAKKRLWKTIVQAKIRAQASNLERALSHDGGLRALIPRVRSGDPDNIEARAARRYWALFFAENGDRFLRANDEDPRNHLLNYGYAVLRAVTARAICACGLHPTFSLQHGNAFNPFALADDLMEPFRPAVDWSVRALSSASSPQPPSLVPEVKRALIAAVLGRVVAAGEERSLPDVILRVAQSLAAVVTRAARSIDIPQWSPLEDG